MFTEILLLVVHIVSIFVIITYKFKTVLLQIQPSVTIDFRKAQHLQLWLQGLALAKSDVSYAIISHTYMTWNAIPCQA